MKSVCKFILIFFAFTCSFVAEIYSVTTQNSALKNLIPLQNQTAFTPKVYAASATTQAFISEINFKGSIDNQTFCVSSDFIDQNNRRENFCGKDQWVEIYNPSDTNIDLQNWSLELRGNQVINLDSLSLPARSRIVVGYTDTSFKSVINRFLDLADFKMLRISNDQLNSVKVVLKNGSIVIDSVQTDNTSDYFNNTPQKGYSFERCSVESNWKLATNPISEAPKGNFGTPKSGQDCPSTNPPVNQDTGNNPDNSPTTRQPEISRKPSNVPVRQPVTKLVKISKPTPVLTKKPQTVHTLELSKRLRTAKQKARIISNSSYVLNFNLISNLDFSEKFYSGIYGERWLPMINFGDIQTIDLGRTPSMEMQIVFGIDSKYQILTVDILLLTVLIIKLINRKGSKKLKFQLN